MSSEVRCGGPVAMKRADAARHAGERRTQPCEQAAAPPRQSWRAGLPRRNRDSARPRRPAGDRAAAQGRARSAELAELGEEQRHLGFVGRQAAAGAKRAIQRFLDQARRLGFVGELEAGIDVGLERELAQQRSGRTRRSSRWRCRRGSRESRATTPAVMARSRWRRRQFVQDALPHLRGGLARERDREDVARLDAGRAASRRSGPPARASCRCRPRLRARRCGVGSTPAPARLGDRGPRRRSPRRFEVEPRSAQSVTVRSPLSRTLRRRSRRSRRRRMPGGRRCRRGRCRTSDRRAGRGGKWPAAIVVQRRRAADPARRRSRSSSGRPWHVQRDDGLVALERQIQRLGERHVAAARGARATRARRRL